MGVHLVFFLHVTTGSNDTNIMTLGFGMRIVMVVGDGSLWIMVHLTGNMVSMDQMMRTRR